MGGRETFQANVRGLSNQGLEHINSGEEYSRRGAIAARLASVPNPKFARMFSLHLRELRVQKGHWHHKLASVALVRKFVSEYAENAGELPNRDTGAGEQP